MNIELVDWDISARYAVFDEKDAQAIREIGGPLASFAVDVQCKLDLFALQQRLRPAGCNMHGYCFRPRSRNQRCPRKRRRRNAKAATRTAQAASISTASRAVLPRQESSSLQAANASWTSSTTPSYHPHDSNEPTLRPFHFSNRCSEPLRGTAETLHSLIWARQHGCQGRKRASETQRSPPPDLGSRHEYREPLRRSPWVSVWSAGSADVGQWWRKAAFRERDLRCS